MLMYQNYKSNVFGESMLNDAVAITLYKSLLFFVLNTQVYKCDNFKISFTTYLKFA